MKKSASIKVGNVKLTAEGEYYKGDPGVHTLRNGDPGYPPSPAEFEIEKIFIDVPGATPIEITDLLEKFNEIINGETKKAFRKGLEKGGMKLQPTDQVKYYGVTDIMERLTELFTIQAEQDEN